LITILLIGFIITIILLFQKRKEQQEKDLENLRISYENEILQTKLEIQEDVLKNVSMEIHDNIGQILLLANVNVSLLQTMVIPNEATALIKDTKLMLQKASEDISQFSRSMNSDRITEMGVIMAMIDDLGFMEKKGLFEVRFECIENYTGKNWPRETQLLVFRMFQEICSNIIKHAQAGTVELKVAKVAHGIEVIIIDNGVGFDFQPIENQQSFYNGVGLRSLQTRAQYFNGKISIKSLLNSGTTIVIFIPL
jgi:signal transduction histidine kinase